MVKSRVHAAYRNRRRPRGQRCQLRPHLRAANLTPATQRAYLDGLTLLARFLTEAGMPTDVTAISREHVEAFITDQLERLSPPRPPTAIPDPAATCASALAGLLTST